MEIQQQIKKFPEKEYRSAKVYAGEQIMLMKPKNFLTGVQVVWEDFHFALPVMPPPPVRIGQKEYRFKQGRLLVFHPDSIALLTETAPCREYFAITVDRNMVLDTVLEMTGKRELKAVNLENVYSRQLMSSILNFQQEALNTKDQSPLMLQSVSLQLVIQLIREIGNNNGIREISAIPDRPYIEKAIDYLMAYYNANITIEDVCAEIHVSQYHFIRMFRKNTGWTPHEYLLRIRLNKAKELLEKGGCSIEEAAKQCGFVNPGHFTSVFKRYVGMPPSVYRKKHLILSLQANI